MQIRVHTDDGTLSITGPHYTSTRCLTAFSLHGGTLSRVFTVRHTSRYGVYASSEAGVGITLAHDRRATETFRLSKDNEVDPPSVLCHGLNCAPFTERTTQLLIPGTVPASSATETMRVIQVNERSVEPHSVRLLTLTVEALFEQLATLRDEIGSAELTLFEAPPVSEAIALHAEHLRLISDQQRLLRMLTKQHSNFESRRIANDLQALQGEIEFHAMATKTTLESLQSYLSSASFEWSRG